MPAVFVIKRNDDGKFVFDIVNRNRTIASSAAYNTKALLQNQISGINPHAVIDDQSLLRRPAGTAPASSAPKLAPSKVTKGMAQAVGKAVDRTAKLPTRGVVATTAKTAATTAKGAKTRTVTNKERPTAGTSVALPPARRPRKHAGR